MGTQIRFSEEAYQKLQQFFNVDFRTQKYSVTPKAQEKIHNTIQTKNNVQTSKHTQVKNQSKHQKILFFNNPPSPRPKKTPKPKPTSILLSGLPENYYATSRNTLPQTRKNQRARILNPGSSARKKSTEWDAKQAQILRKELVELRNLQNKNIPGFNDFDRNAMK